MKPLKEYIKMNRHISITILASLFLFSCNGDKDKSDAYGTFEAEEIMISSEANGRILSLEVEEGSVLDSGKVIGQIEDKILRLQKEQLEQSIKAILSRQPDKAAQLAVFDKQIATLQEQKTAVAKDRDRIAKMLKELAATQKQYDDVQTQYDLLEKQIDVIKTQKRAMLSSLNTQTTGLENETNPVMKQIELLEFQIAKAQLVNPVAGTVLAQYAEAGEVAAFGKPLYKISDLREIYLRAFVSGIQLSEIKLGQSVKVFCDAPEGMKEYTGQISWISSSAEFTPKIIQTKEERVNLVYAIKIRVKNDGSLKIGMPGEVKF